MTQQCQSITMIGLTCVPVSVEVDVARGQPSFTIVGLGDLAVQEARERIWSAIRNSPFDFPLTRKTVNLAPSGTKKYGTHYDLAIAVALLGASGQCPGVRRGTFLLAELGLDGHLRPIHGVLPLVLGARMAGADTVVVAEENAREAGLCEGVKVRAASNLASVVDWLDGRGELPHVPAWKPSCESGSDVDLRDIRGQHIAKRALEVSAAGAHTLLLWGPPGSGKTLLAQALVGLLPPPTWEETLETTKIHSLAGILPGDTPLVMRRPLRSPHHTASCASLVGGGSIPRPGEYSLAHNGVLFLDELPLFRRDALESLREPLERGVVHVSRASGSVTFPAGALIVAAMNPCMCGPRISGCTCTEGELLRYRARLSGPLLDRIDLLVPVERVDAASIVDGEACEGSSVVRQRVEQARAHQRRRGQSCTNAMLPPRDLEVFCGLDGPSRALLLKAADRLSLSARAVHRIVRVARTIADLSLRETVEPEDLSEALQYRSARADAHQEHHR